MNNALKIALLIGEAEKYLDKDVMKLSIEKKLNTSLINYVNDFEKDMTKKYLKGVK